MSKKKGLSPQERMLMGIQPTAEELEARFEELRREPTEEERQAELERYMAKPQVAAALRTAIPDPKPAEPKVSESVRKMLEASANARRRALVSTYGEEAVAAVEMEEQEFEAERERRLKEIRKAFLKSLPPEIQNSPAALMAFTKAQKQAGKATEDVGLLGRVGVGARSSINSMWLAAHNALFGADGRELRAILGEPTVQDTEAARRAGQIAGVTPPQGTAGQIAGAVGEFIPAAVVGTAAGVAAGPGAAGAVFGSIGTGAAFYPYVSQMADVQYQQDLFSRNLDRVLSGSGNFEAYDPEVANAFRTNSALMESGIEAASTLLQIKAAKIAGGAIFGRTATRATTKPSWSRAVPVRQRSTLRYGIGLAQETARAIDEATMRSAVGRTARAIGGLGLASATEGAEEVAADVLGARIGRATGATPEAESTPESRRHSFVIGAGAGLVIGLGAAPVAAGVAEASRLVERKQAAILSGEVVAAARDSLQDQNIAVQTLSRMAAMTPEERQEAIDGWSEQRETELSRLQNAQAETAVAAEKLAKAKGTEAERDAQRDFDAARMRADNIVADIETIDTILASAATAVGEETVVPDPDAKAVTPDEVIERTSRERPLLDIRPTKSKGNKVERSVASTLRGLGFDVVFYEAEPDANPAFYNSDTPGVVYMRVRSKGERVLNPFARSRRTLLAKALHEVVHDLQWYSPELYSEIREILGDKTVIKNGIEYLQRGSGIQIVGPRRGDFAAVGGLLVTRPEQEETGLATVLARGVRPETAKLAKGPEARAVARIEEEGVPVAIERGVERAESMVGRALAKVGLESREAKAARKLLERLEQRKAQAVPRPVPGTRQFRAELAPMKGDSPEVAAAKRRMAEIEGIAEMRREAAEAGETPRAQMARVKAGSRFEEETNLVRLTAMQAGREPISAFSMLELAMAGGVDPRSGAKVNPIMGKRGTVKQLLAGLQKAGVKPEEISWRLGSFLVTKSDEDIVTAQEVSDALAKTRLVVTYGPTKETNMNTGGTLNVEIEPPESVTVEELLEMPSDPVPDDSPRIVRYLLAAPTNGSLSNIVMRITADPLMPTEQAAKLFEANDEFKSHMESVFSGGATYGDPYRVAWYLERIPQIINEKLMESIRDSPPEAGYVYKFKVDVSVAFDGFAYRPEIVETNDIEKQTQDFIENDGNGSYPRFDGQQLPQMLVEVSKPKKSEGIYRNASYSPNRLPDSSDYRGSLGRSVVDFTYEIEATYNGPSKWGRPSVTYQANVSSHAGWGETTNAEVAAKGVVHSLVILNREKALAETYDGFSSVDSGGIKLRRVMLPAYRTFVDEAQTDTSDPRMDLRSSELAGSVVVKEQILEPRKYLQADDLPRVAINKIYAAKIKTGTLVVTPDQWSGGDALGDAVTAEIDPSRPIAEQYKALVNKFLESVDLESEGAKQALRGGHVLEGRVVFEYDYTETHTEVTYENRQAELNDVIQSSVEIGSRLYTSNEVTLALKTSVSSEGVPEMVYQGYTYGITGNLPGDFSRAIVESAQDWMDNDIVGKDFDDIGEAEEIVEGRTFQDIFIQIIESPFLAAERYPGIVYPSNWNAGYGRFRNPLPMSYSDGRFVTGINETTMDVTTASFAGYRPKRSKDNPDYAIFTMTYDSGPTATDYQEPHGLGDAVSAHVRVTFDSDDVFFIDEVQSTARKEISKGSIILRPDVFEGIGVQVSDLFPGPPVKTQTTYQGNLAVDLVYDNRLANYWTQVALSEAYEAFDQAVASAFESATYSDELSQNQGRRTIAAEGVFEHDIVVDPNVTARVKIKFGVYAHTKLDQDGNEILLSRDGNEFVPYSEDQIRAYMYDPVSARSTLASQVMLGAELNSAYDRAMRSEVAGSLSVQVLSAKHGVIVAESKAYNYGNISMRYNDFRDGIEYALTTVDDYLENFADKFLSQGSGGIPTNAMPYVAKPHGGDVRSFRAVASDSFAEAVVKGIIGNSVRIADERNPTRDYDDSPLKLTFPSVKDGMASHMNEKGALAIYGPKGFIPKAAEKVLKSIGSKAQLVTDTPTADAKENTVSIVVDERIADIARNSGFTQFARSKSEALRTPADQFSVVRYNDDTYLVKTQFSRILATHAISPDNFVANIDTGQIVNPSIGVIPAVKAMSNPQNSRVIWAKAQPIVLVLSPSASEKYLPGTTRVADTYSPSGLTFIPAMSSAELTGLMQDVTRRASQIEERILTSSPEELESIVSGLFDQASIAASAKPQEHEVRSIIGKWAKSKEIPESAFDPDVTTSRNVVMNAIALVTLQRALTDTLPEPLSMVFPTVDVPDAVAKKLGMPEIRSMIAEIETVLNYDGMSIDQVAAEISSIAAEAANQINVMVSNLSEVGNRVLGWKVALKGSKTSEFVDATEAGLVELAQREWGGNPLGKERPNVFMEDDFVAKVVNDKVFETFEDVVNYVTSGKIGFWASTNADGGLTRVGQALHDIDYHVRSVAMSSWHASTWTPESGRYPYPDKFDHLMESGPNAVPPYSLPRDAAKLKPLDRHMRRVVFAMSQAVTKVLDTGVDARLEDLYSQKWIDIANNPELAGFPSYREAMFKVVGHVNNAAKAWRELKFSYAESNPVAPIPLGQDGFSQVHLDAERIMDMRAKTKDRPGLRTQGGGVRRLRDDGSYKRFLGSVAEFINLGGTVFFHSNSNGEFKTFVGELSDAFMAEAANERPGVMAPGGGVYVSEAKIRSAIKFADMNANRDSRAGGFEYSVGYHASQMARAKRFKQNPPIGIAGDSVLNDIALLERTQDPFASNPISYSPFIESSDNDMRRMLKMRHDLIRKTYQETGPYSGGLVKVRDGFELYDPQVDAYYPQADAFGYKNPDTLEREYWNEATRQAHMTHVREVDARLRAAQGLASIHAALSYSIAEARQIDGAMTPEEMQATADAMAAIERALEQAYPAIDTPSEEVSRVLDANMDRILAAEQQGFDP